MPAEEGRHDEEGAGHNGTLGINKDARTGDIDCCLARYVPRPAAQYPRLRPQGSDNGCNDSDRITESGDRISKEGDR